MAERNGQTGLVGQDRARRQAVRGGERVEDVEALEDVVGDCSAGRRRDGVGDTSTETDVLV